MNLDPVDEVVGLEPRPEAGFGEPERCGSSV
jgi:hypothetical protein